MRKTLANLLFLFIGLPVTLSALLLISVRPWALDREVYKRFVQDDRLYTALQDPGIVSEMPANFELRPASGAAGEAVSIDVRALASAAQKDLPWPAIKSTGTSAVDAAFDAIEGKTAGGAISLSLKELKASVKNSLPAISRDYLAAAKGATLPAGAASQAKVTALLGSYVDLAPDLVQATPPSASMRTRVSGIPIGVMSRAGGLTQAILNQMTASTAAISALLIAGLGALGGTSLVSRLSRAGRYLLIPSIVVFGLGVALAIPAGLILQNLLPAGLREMIAGPAGAIFRAYLVSALGPIAQTFFVSGLVGVSLGGVLASAKRFGGLRELEEDRASSRDETKRLE
jgi:hypothetical protein